MSAEGFVVATCDVCLLDCRVGVDKSFQATTRVLLSRGRTHEEEEEDVFISVGAAAAAVTL